MNILDISKMAGESEFEVSFNKVDGSPRSFKCHCGAAKVFKDNVKGGSAAYDFAAKRILPVWVDSAYNSNGKSGFRSVKLDSITKVTVAGQTYTVDADGELVDGTS